MSVTSLFLRARFSVLSRAISIRLRLSRMLQETSLPELLQTFTPERAPHETSPPLTVALDTLSQSERVLRSVPSVPNTCLYRSLARYAVLRGFGYRARFFMAIDPGVRTDIEGHAWVELDGRPLFEAIDPRLIVTYSYPANAEPLVNAA